MLHAQQVHCWLPNHYSCVGAHTCTCRYTVLDFPVSEKVFTTGIYFIILCKERHCDSKVFNWENNDEECSAEVGSLVRTCNLVTSGLIPVLATGWCCSGGPEITSSGMLVYYHNVANWSASCHLEADCSFKLFLSLFVFVGPEKTHWGSGQLRYLQLYLYVFKWMTKMP